MSNELIDKDLWKEYWKNYQYEKYQIKSFTKIIYLV